MTGPVPPHWIRANDTARQPRCWIYFDTEARVVNDERGPIQVWRCGVTAHDHRRDRAATYRETEWADHASPASLWEWIDARARPSVRTVVVAHNLAYDLRISDAFAQLTALGWHCDRVRLDSQQAQVRWRHGKRTILCIDTMSWVPVSLDVLGAEVGVAKVRLPGWDASDERWLVRCRRDVEILQAVWRRIIGWLTEIDAGTWQPTGAAQSWTVWRHKFLTDRVLVNAEPAVRAVERESVWSGRTEAWKHGRLTAGPYTEWDYQACYLRVARECVLPRRYVGRVSRPRMRDVQGWAGRSCVLARVRARLDVPILPARSDHGIFWPVGEVETIVWWPEVELALAEGAEIELLECWVYNAAPVLAAFAEWCLPIIDGERDGADPIVRRVAKHWSRALIGRFGVRYTTWEKFGDALVPGVGLTQASDADTGRRFRVLTIGDEAMAEGDLIEGENAAPMVMGYVMAEARVRLWRAMRAAGLDHVVYVDTDGLIVDHAGDAALEAAGVDGLRRKSAWRSLHVWGPRQLLVGGEVRVAGVPRRARRVAERTFEGEVWPYLGSSIARGEAAGVRVVARRMSVRATDHRRQHLGASETAPMVVQATRGPENG